ncbi:MAG: trypsin-like peptidase domain-containing protein, partial [Actinobacteria bacterium]|nr:trypsin-like peptidase domain-containing protein [Actinomycetota bacterium]
RPTADDVADLVARVLPVVVTIEAREGPFTTDGPPRGSVGTGFFFRSDGLILTNEHVLPESGTVRVVLQNGTRLEATIVGRDPWDDFAVLRATGGPFPTLELGDSDAARLGEPVVAIGSPLNFRNTVTTGVVSGTGREFPKSVNSEAGPLSVPLRGMLQTDAAINSGNSGGGRCSTCTAGSSGSIPRCAATRRTSDSRWP